MSELTERVCLICLDGPQVNNPIHLLACGCQTSWFHRSCQISWIEHTSSEDFPLKCPTCKRYIQTQLHYEYHPSFGKAQQLLQYCTFLVAAESFLAVCLFSQYTIATGMDLPEVILIPCQSILLFYLPTLFSQK